MLSTVRVLMILSIATAHCEKRTEGQCMDACGHSFLALFTAKTNNHTCWDCAYNQPVTERLCSFACGRINVPERSLKPLSLICMKCFSSENVKIAENMCINDCDARKSSFPSSRRTCLRCVRTPPVTANMCIHACENRNNNMFYSICRRCSIHPPKSAYLCLYACKDTAFLYYKAICNSKACN